MEHNLTVSSSRQKALTIFCTWVARVRERKNSRNEMHWVLSQKKKTLLAVLPLHPGTPIKRPLDGGMPFRRFWAIDIGAFAVHQVWCGECSFPSAQILCTSVVVYSGFHIKEPWTGLLTRQKFILHSSGSWEIQGQGTIMVGFILWHILSLQAASICCIHIISLWALRKQESSLVCLLIRTPILWYQSPNYNLI